MRNIRVDCCDIESVGALRIAMTNMMYVGARSYAAYREQY